jgi:hypothetical protein
MTEDTAGGAYGIVSGKDFNIQEKSKFWICDVEGPQLHKIQDDSFYKAL